MSRGAGTFDSHKQDIVLFSGSGHPELAKSIAARLGLPLSKVTLGHFSNRETSIQIDQSVRNADVYIIQSFHHKNVNDMLMEVLILVHACKIASAHKVTAVLPYFPYSKQPTGPYDKTASQVEALLARAQKEEQEKDSGSHEFYSEFPIYHRHLRITSEMLTPNTGAGGSSNATTPRSLSIDNISLLPLNVEEGSAAQERIPYKTWRSRNGKLVANMLAVAGADHVITMDLHDAQYQGFFDIPVDNLKAHPMLSHYIKDTIQDLKQIVIVSPDAGGAKRAIQMAQLLGVDFAMIHKERRKKRGLKSDPVWRLPGIIESHYSGSTPTVTDSFATMQSMSSLALASPMNCSMFASPVTQNTSTLLVHGRVIVGNVKDKTVIILDDLADTCNTLIKAAQVAIAYGAKRVIALVSHGIFSGDSLDRLVASPLEQVIITNSVPVVLEKDIHREKIKILDLGYLFGETIRRIHYGESVSTLFDPRAFKGIGITRS
jgi:ribose-phosphate pyrophosphokinase